MTEVEVTDCHRGSSIDSRRSPEVDVPVSGADAENGVVRGSSGSQSVDKALIQHLIHCESLLVVCMS